DIVSKEMYAFIDQGGDHLCLRPEGTASAVRAWLQAGLSRSGAQRWYYIGPMFRRERPQKGRLRQFNQIGVEWLGTPGPLADAEMLAMAAAFLDAIGVRDVRIEINSLGCAACRPAYRETLVAWLKARADALCETCATRIDRNPMRVLDCKLESCREALQGAPEMIAHLCGDCAAHFDGLRRGLKALGVPYVVNGRIVRGLDYYTRTAFEFVTDRLGAQGTVLAGGRYDGLVQALGGPPTPAIGFAAGVERLAMMRRPKSWPGAGVAVVSLGDEAELASLALASALRAEGISVLHCGGGGAKRQFKQADREGARVVVVLGEDELREGAVTVRDMATGEQRKVPRGGLSACLREMPLSAG
ncbi:MAG: histidine--tRNA ligase, partial [Mariprofundaceae bacterium]